MNAPVHPLAAADALAQRVRTCRSKKQALRIAAELVLLHEGEHWSAANLGSDFRYALLEIFEEQEAGL